MDSPSYPTHIAIIMDGNGRWATSRGLPRTSGHRAGADAVLRTLDYCLKYGIRYLTLYAFSTENWKRSLGEISALMSLLSEFLEKQSAKLHQSQTRLHVRGDLERIPQPARGKLKQQVKESANYDRQHLTLALSYGGRAEITGAARQLARDVAEGRLRLSDITEERMASYLQTADLPDPDLIIRTAGEQRLSNFLLWQASYAEFWFTPVLWPDFNEDTFQQALEAYASRQRRFGKA